MFYRRRFALNLYKENSWSPFLTLRTPVIEPLLQARRVFINGTSPIINPGGVGLFTVNGPQIGRDSLLVNPEQARQFTPYYSVHVCYARELARKNYPGNGFSAGSATASGPNPNGNGKKFRFPFRNGTFSLLKTPDGIIPLSSTARLSTPPHHLPWACGSCRRKQANVFPGFPR